MTREEIVRFQPGPRTDRLVAEKVMGWEEGTNFYIRENRLMLVAAIWDANKQQWIPTSGLPWSPSTDIAAAWQVLEAMRRNGGRYRIWSPCAEDDEWEVELFPGNSDEAAIARAPSLPLAICRATLLAATGDEEVKDDRFRLY